MGSNNRVRGPRNIFNENIRKQEFGVSKTSTSPSEPIPSKTEQVFGKCETNYFSNRSENLYWCKTKQKDIENECKYWCRVLTNAKFGLGGNVADFVIFINKEGERDDETC